MIIKCSLEEKQNITKFLEENIPDCPYQYNNNIKCNNYNNCIDCIEKNLNINYEIMERESDK